MIPSPRGRRPPIFGPEAWAEVAGEPWCHFDRWFALVIETDFTGDADALRDELERQLRSSLHGRQDVIAKLSHLADLLRRLDAAGIGSSVLVAADPADKAAQDKARRKVLSQALEGRSMTEPMRHTPAACLDQRAKYGHWDRFPSNPDRFHQRLAGRRHTYTDKGGSFRVVDAHVERLRRLDGPRRSLPDRLALYRAFHTVGIALAERVDDSYGVLGQARREAFLTYLEIDWAAAGMDRTVYWRDLCELLVSEVYGLTYRHETAAFARANTDDAELIEAILLDLADEYGTAYQDYQADEALQLIAWCRIETGGHAKYADAARRLGTNHWIPIEALACSALDAGQPELTLAVFRAADRPGLHRDYLRRRCQELTGIDLRADADP